jgi:4-amino-4-deoxy-L-arabinose transferase-like glycosyltransferase
LFDLYGKNIFSLPNSGFDSEMYYRSSVSYMMSGDAGNGEMFSKVMGTIFSFIGTNRVYAQFIVVLFSVVSLCMLAEILNEIGYVSEHVKYKTILVVALLPNFAILSSIYLRESIVTMFISISLYFFARWVKGKREINFIVAGLLAFLAASFHGGAIVILIGYIASRLLIDRNNFEIRLKISNIVMVIIFVGVFSYLYVNYSSLLFNKIGGISSVSEIANVSDEGGASYAAYVGDSSTPIRMAIFTLPRIVYFLFSPFPWQWRGMADIIAFLFSSLFYLITIKNAINCIRGSNNHEQKTLTIVFLVIALCCAFVFSWGVSNTGTASRHRDKLIILYAVLYAISNPDSEYFYVIDE